MRRFVCALSLASAVAAGVAAPGCSDVGDSSAMPASDTALAFEDGSSPESATDDAPAVAVPESSATDSTMVLASDGAGTFDTGAGDVATSAEEGGAADVTVDGTVADAGAVDSTVADSGVADTGSVADAGAPDARTDATASRDSGSSGDAGKTADSGADAGGVLAACTTAGQTSCVQCEGSTGGACTPTESLIVQYDIAHGYAKTAGADPPTGCYTCLFMAGGLDDVTFGDTDHECGDLAGSTNQTECLTTLGCILGSSCAKTEVSTCYCGTAPVSGSCTSGGANGACDNQEAAGLGYAESDGLDILKNFTSTTLPSGVANNIFQNALSNGCSMCVP